MPPILKVAQSKLLKFPFPREKAQSAFFAKDLPDRIKASLTKGSFIPFAIRALIDDRNNKQLTSFQQAFVQVLKNSNTDTRLLRQYARLPKTVQKAFDQSYFTVSQTDADELLKKSFLSTSEEVYKGMQIALVAKQPYFFVTAFRPVVVPLHSLSNMPTSPWPPPPPPDKYNFELSYQGIQTLKTQDRSGGVEPYLVANFNRVTLGVLDKLVEPFVIKQKPWNLGDMDQNEWEPSGGTQDQYGNPSNPIVIFNGDFPPLDPTLSYYAVIKVMEQDGGQGSKIAKAMGEALIGIGGLIAGSTGVTGIGAVIGGIVAGLGFVSEFIGAIFSSNEADDFIGDILLWINSNDICSKSFIKDSAYVHEGDNHWNLYFGLRSKDIN